MPADLTSFVRGDLNSGARTQALGIQDLDGDEVALELFEASDDVAVDIGVFDEDFLDVLLCPLRRLGTKVTPAWKKKIATQPN